MKLKNITGMLNEKINKLTCFGSNEYCKYKEHETRARHERDQHIV